MRARTLVRVPGEGGQVTLAGKPLTFLVTGEDTTHASMFDWTPPPGFSTELHVHRVQEKPFYVLEGECRREVGGRVIEAKPGAYVFIPPRRCAQYRKCERKTGAYDYDGSAPRS